MGLEGGDEKWVKSLKMLEGGGELSTGKGREEQHLEGMPRHTPLCPAGHLPLKGGDRGRHDQRSLSFLWKSRRPAGDGVR